MLFVNPIPGYAYVEVYVFKVHSHKHLSLVWLALLTYLCVCLLLGNWKTGASDLYLYSTKRLAKRHRWPLSRVCVCVFFFYGEFNNEIMHAVRIPTRRAEASEIAARKRGI